MTTSAPALIAKRSVRYTCREVMGRGAISFAISIFTFWALLVGDHLFLASVFGGVALVSVGMVFGAALVENKV